MTEKLVAIGLVRKPHGTKGEMKFTIEDPFFDDFLDASEVFIKMRGSILPFAIESIRGENDTIVRLREVDSIESALLLAGKEVFLLSENLADMLQLLNSEAETDHSDLAGFEIHDETEGQVGLISEVIEMPQQEMAIVKRGKKEILIPLNEDFILRIDASAKIVFMDLPEGLLDL
jgi:16S rRNA processing protein RimM